MATSRQTDDARARLRDVSQGRDGERGAVVVEFALVFVLFMTLLSGLISYGAIFAAQQTLTHAAAEAARVTVGQPTVEDARARARQSLEQQLGWLDSDGCDSPTDGGPRPQTTCEMDLVPCDQAAPGELQCITVTITYNWKDYAVVPLIIPLPTPDLLRGTATIVWDN